MTDISKFLFEKRPWTAVQDVVRLADAAARSTGGTVDWDQGAGERWLRIIVGAQVVAAFSVESQLALRRTDVRIDVGDADEIAVRTFDERSLSAQGAALDSFARHRVSRNVDFDEMSANDLIWLTV